ncbi:YceI family protein [Pseudorhodoferax sp.]|uniref:YceI family protein n=1 Tax=Pseudorhodoferax sp. TaxID=1993553 RepID=UPI002DD6AA3F|nr:YceI family protein [Pseudorhodoferax sp.]
MPTRRLSLLTLAATLLGGGFAPVALAQPQPAQLQAAGSEIVFITRQMGVPVEGRFTAFKAQVALDPKKPETGKVAFSIDTGSARFGSAELDAEVPKPVWLGVVKFPQASFESTAIKAAGPGRFEVAGKLTIKGVARDITVPVQLVQAGAASTASGSFTIRRLDFKVGEGEWTDTSMLANEVQVRFKLGFTGLGAP